MINNSKVSAIVLAGGKGTRMGAAVSKQYLLLGEHPVLYYALKTFENSVVDEVVLVVAEGETEYCRKEIVEKYHFHKVKKIVTGGKERYHSVYQGLAAIEHTDLVMIHDGARPFISKETIAKLATATMEWKACVVGVPVKDTIKVSNENTEIVSTPDRSRLWQVQTPQSFVFPEIKEAYEKILNNSETNITDDAMIWEACSDIPVKLIEGDYFNIKITTPEDMIFGAAILQNKGF